MPLSRLRLFLKLFFVLIYLASSQKGAWLSEARADVAEICRVVLAGEKYKTPDNWVEVYNPLRSHVSQMFGLPVLESDEGLHMEHADGAFLTDPLRIQINPHNSYVRKTVALNHQIVHAATARKVNSPHASNIDILRAIIFQSEKGFLRLPHGKQKIFQVDEALAYREDAGLVHAVSVLDLQQGYKSFEVFQTESESFKIVTGFLLYEAIHYMKLRMKQRGSQQLLSLFSAGEDTPNLYYIQIKIGRDMGLNYEVYLPIYISPSFQKGDINPTYVIRTLENALEVLPKL